MSKPHSHSRRVLVGKAYLNEALADAASDEDGDPPADPPRYRSLGFGKIWTSGSFRAAGFDFGWKGLLKGRATIKPVLDFILDKRVEEDDDDTEEYGPDVPYSAFCADKRAECPKAAERMSGKYSNEKPWFVCAATNRTIGVDETVGRRAVAARA